MEFADTAHLRRLALAPGPGKNMQIDGLPPVEFTRKRDTLRVGLLVPFSGIDALWGPSSQYSAVLAAALINANGGVLGREIELFAVDSGGTPSSVVHRVTTLVNDYGIQALVGTHMSNIRIAVRDSFAHRVPYVYATQYEGGETSPGVFAIGETPAQQYQKAVEWMVQNEGAKRWHLLGNDYVWPRKTNAIVAELIANAGGEVVGCDYIPFGQAANGDYVHGIASARPDIVFETLVGTDCVEFNKQFGSSKLSRNIKRLSGVIEENVLMGIGIKNSHNLYGVAGYFNSLDTIDNRSFLYEYTSAFGEAAPVQGGMSQPCYESMFFLASLAHKAGSFSIDKLTDASRNFTYYGARGEVKLSDFGAEMDCHLMRADGFGYQMVKSFSV
jgi:urea transport system substrate-binding protein